MRLHVKNLLGITLLVGVVGWMVFQAETAVGQMELNEKDRIVFLGDSITQAGQNRPYGYVRLVRQALAESVPGAEVIGAGISGHKVPDLIRRLDRDVIKKDPTVVVIYIGINDVWHSLKEKGTDKADFESGLKSIITDIGKAGAKAVLCTASVIGEKTDKTNPLDAMLDEYCDISRAVATEMKIPLIDLRKAFMDYLVVNNSENKEKDILTTDGVHLNEKGNQFVADQMLKGLGQFKQPEANKVLRHVVLFKFKDDVNADQVDEIVTAFGELKSQIDDIVDYEFGTDVSPENLSQGFTHCFVVTFADEAGRDRYLPHPAHKAFVELIGGKIDKVLVVDFMANKVN